MKLPTKLNIRAKQAGMTLIELMAALAIGGLVVGGALALYSSASGTQGSSQLSSDLTALGSSVKQLYNGQGGYGTASLNSVLITSNKVPTTMSISGSTITHPLNGTITVTGATAQFTMTVTNIATDICVSLVSGSSGYATIQVGAAAARTLPITPTNAATDCAGGAKTLIFTAA